MVSYCVVMTNLHSPIWIFVDPPRVSMMTTEIVMIRKDVASTTTTATIVVISVCVVVHDDDLHSMMGMNVISIGLDRHSTRWFLISIWEYQYHGRSTNVLISIWKYLAPRSMTMTTPETLISIWN